MRNQLFISVLSPFFISVLQSLNLLQSEQCLLPAVNKAHLQCGHQITLTSVLSSFYNLRTYSVETRYSVETLRHWARFGGKMVRIDKQTSINQIVSVFLTCSMRS